MRPDDEMSDPDIGLHPDTVEAAAQKLYAASDIFEQFRGDLQRLGYVSGPVFAHSLLISHGARLLDRTTGFVFYGPSGSGKSEGVLTAAKLLPPEVPEHFTATSVNSFFYFGNLKGRYLILGEVKPTREGQSESRQEAWRQLISENRLIRGVVEKADGGSNQLERKVVEGPCVIVATTTTEPADWHDEFANRNSWVRADDSAQMTEAVLALRAERARQPGSDQLVSEEFIARKWQAYHRRLRPLKVLIPYADAITPTNSHVTARRLFALVLDYVAASALLHQASRERTEQGGVEFVVANAQDYQTTYDLLTSNAPRLLDVCGKPALDAFDRLRGQLARGPLTPGQIQALLQQSRATTTRRIGELVRAGLLAPAGKAGRRAAYMLGGDAAVCTQEIGLVPPESLLGRVRFDL